MKKKKGIKITIIIIITIFILFAGLIIYWVFKDLKQEEVLKQEIINYSNRDLYKDDFQVTVETTGDYAYVEEAVKKYYKQLSDNVKKLEYYLTDDKLSNILSAQNLMMDKPNFTSSHTTIKNAKNNISKSIKQITNLCDEKTIKSLLDKAKLDDEEYYYDLYLQLMYTDQDAKEFAELKKEMGTLSTNLNEFLDKIDEILIFLEKNNSSVKYTKEGVYFNSNATLNEYKKLINQLDEIGNKIETSAEQQEKTVDM